MKKWLYFIYYLHDRLDRLSPYEQLVVKCAAVQGDTTSYKMLLSITPGSTKKKLSYATKQLIMSRVFDCRIHSEGMCSLKKIGKRDTNNYNVIKFSLY